jgi:hypothetical protein
MSQLFYYSGPNNSRISSYYENPWKRNKVINLPSKAVNKGLVIGIATARPSTFFLSILVLIFTEEVAIKMSCGSSGTPVYSVNVARSL